MIQCPVCGDDGPGPEESWPQISQCYWNARGTLEKHHAGGVYVEGWAVWEWQGKRKAFEHGWVEVDGGILDETPHHHVPSKCFYFPVLRYTLDQLNAKPGMAYHRELTDPDASSYDPAFAAQWAAARQQAEALAAG